MSVGKIFRTLLRRSSPLMLASSYLFEYDMENKKPTAEDKLKFEPPDLKKLTFEYMIQQSTIDAAKSAMQALTVTHMAILSTSNEYKDLLNELIALSKETLQFTVTDEHWDMIVELRSKVQSKKEILNKLTGYMDFVHKMAQAASEISYLSGMDSLANSLSQGILTALQNIKQECNGISTLEQEYQTIQEQCIRNSNPKQSDEIE